MDTLFLNYTPPDSPSRSLFFLTFQVAAAETLMGETSTPHPVLIKVFDPWSEGPCSLQDSSESRNDLLHPPVRKVRARTCLDMAFPARIQRGMPPTGDQGQSQQVSSLGFPYNLVPYYAQIS